MCRRFIRGLLLALPLTLPAVAQTPREAPRGSVVSVPVTAPARPAAPRYDLSLLPDPLDVSAGNAAQHWLHANQAASQGPPITEKESNWLSPELPLKDLPGEEAQKFLERHK